MNHISALSTGLCLLLGAGCSMDNPSLPHQSFAGKQTITSSDQVSLKQNSSQNYKNLVSQTNNCANASNQAEINRCALQNAQAADKKLNQTYQTLLPKLAASQKQNLVKAQRAWIEFKDSNCAYEKNRFEKGSIAPMVYHNCMERVTKQRTTDLENYLKPGWPVCTEGC